MLKKIPLIILLTLSLFLISCGEKEGPAEKAGKKIDDTYQDVKDKAKDLSEEVSDKADDISDEVSDKIDEVKDDEDDDDDQEDDD